MDKDALLKGAVEAALEAGKLLRDGFGSTIEQKSKEGKHNIVTQFDIASEKLLRERLFDLVPDSSFLGEEGGEHIGDVDLTWIVDPLDGTVNFSHGIPIFCVSLAAQVSGVTQVGVIYHPLLDELFTASVGNGAYLNGSRLSVSATPDVDSSILVTGFPYNVNTNPLNCIDQFSAIVSRGIPVRRLGSAALDLAYTAAGKFDGFWEVALHAWDMAAGALLVEEAGGKVTHYGNREFQLSHDSIIATNGLIHNELVEILDGVQQ